MSDHHATSKTSHQAEPLQQQFSTEKRLGLISSSNFQHHDPFEQSHKKKSPTKARGACECSTGFYWMEMQYAGSKL